MLCQLDPLLSNCCFVFALMLIQPQTTKIQQLNRALLFLWQKLAFAGMDGAWGSAAAPPTTFLHLDES